LQLNPTLFPAPLHLVAPGADRTFGPVSYTPPFNLNGHFFLMSGLSCAKLFSARDLFLLGRRWTSVAVPCPVLAAARPAGGRRGRLIVVGKNPQYLLAGFLNGPIT